MGSGFFGTGLGGNIIYMDESGQRTEVFDDFNMETLMNIIGAHHDKYDNVAASKVSNALSTIVDMGKDVTFDFTWMGPLTGAQTAVTGSRIVSWITSFFGDSTVDALRDAIYKSLDTSKLVSSGSVGVKTEKFDPDSIMVSYDSLKEEADKFAEYNKDVRKVVVDYISVAADKSALYGLPAGYAMTSWDNNITATNNTDDLLKAMALETLQAKMTAEKTDADLSGKFKNGDK